MAEENCRRELDLEIPAAEVQKAIERVAREFARVARVPGFRPGKAPIPLIRRRFADDIKGEVLQSLLPEQIDKAVKDQKLVPITQPQVDHVDYAEDRPLKFRASFEVLPEFELGAYKGLKVEVEKAQVIDADIDKEIEGMRERAATFVPVEERALESGDLRSTKAGRHAAWRRRAAQGRQRTLPPRLRGDAGGLHPKPDRSKARRATPLRCGLSRRLSGQKTSRQEVRL